MTRLHLRRCRMLSCLLLLIAMRPVARGQQSEVLTNQSVVDLVHNGIGTDLIVKMIGDEPNHFVLTSSAVIRLKQQGVPQTVISAMLSKNARPAAPSGAQGNASAGPAPAPAAAASHDKRPNFTWETQDRADKMTGKTESLLILDTPAVTDSGERLGMFEAIATCGSAELDLKTNFISDSKPGFGYKQNTTTYYVTGGLAGALQAAHNHKKAWTESRVKIDDAAPITVTSEEDYLNSSLIYFVKPYDKNDQSGASGLIAFGTMLAANKPAGQIATFLNANRILIESTFEHGEQAILEIHPQDPSLQAFNRRCAESTAAGPAPAERASSSGGGYSSPSPSPSRESVSRPSAPRYGIAAGSTFRVSLLEAVSLDAARSGRPVRARLTSALSSTASGSSPEMHPLSLPAGTEVLLRPRLTSYNANQASVQLSCQSVTSKGVTIPVNASSPATAVSQGSGAAVLKTLSPILRMPVRPTAPNGNSVLLKANDDQYTMTVNTNSMAPANYQP